MIIKSLDHLKLISNKIAKNVSNEDCLFLIGEIGVGKTTLFRAINGLEKIENGEQFQFNGLTFVRGDIRRTRFICTELETKNRFLFHGLAKVKAL